MQILKKSNLFVFYFITILFSLFFVISVVHANITPTLSLSATGNGDSVQLNVTGNPSQSVLLVYTKSGSGQQLLPIGTTDVNGNLVTTISTSADGITASSPVYVLVGGLNGLQSSSTTWPIASSLISTSSMLSLSQTGLVLQTGQTSTITATNLNNSSIYLSNNSNPLIANFNISGSSISVLANGYGSTTGTICLVNNTSNCVGIYVIVQNSNAQPLTFSQSSVSMYSGQSVAIQITGGSGTYSVLSNAAQNNGVVTTSLSGSVITLTTTSTTGSSSITVCSTDMTSCGIINVTFGNASSTAAVSFSQQNPIVTVGQNLNISIYGPSSSLFYVSSNSNPSIVQPNLSGTTLTLLGITNGTSTLSICASSSNCGTLNITVSPNSTNNGGNITFSQSNVTLAIGQNTNVTVSGESMPYTVEVTPSNVFQESLNSNILTIYGIAIGTSSMSVCSSGQCSSITVTVTGTTGQNTILTVPADCTGALYSISTGQECPAATVIPLISSVISNTTSTTSTATSSSTTSTSSLSVKITKYLIPGSTGAQVSVLQSKLKSLGYYKGKVDGGFGTATEASVKAYQKAHGLPIVGDVGPKTRALLNK